jgi:hypothetical protein
VVDALRVVQAAEQRLHRATVQVDRGHLTGVGLGDDHPAVPVVADLPRPHRRHGVVPGLSPVIDVAGTTSSAAPATATAVLVKRFIEPRGRAVWKSCAAGRSSSVPHHLNGDLGIRRVAWHPLAARVVGARRALAVPSVCLPEETECPRTTWPLRAGT